MSIDTRNCPNAYMLKLCSAPEAMIHHMVGNDNTWRTTAKNGGVFASAEPGRSRRGSKRNRAKNASTSPGTPATKKAACQPYCAATRVLKPCGRFAFTAFALESGREATVAFPFRRFDETSAAVDPKYPERAIGHRREVLEAAVAGVGLQVGEFLRGYWAPGGEYNGGQDLFVVTKG